MKNKIKFIHLLIIKLKIIGVRKLVKIKFCYTHIETYPKK